MSELVSPRGWTAIGIVIVTAIIIAVIGAGLEAAALTLVGGIAAVLAGGAGGSVDVDAPATQSPGAGEHRIDVVLDALAEPVLLLEDSRIVTANRAARALLGSHVVGEDVRTAIRHPAAAQRLISDQGNSDGPVALAGLGSPDQRWEMHVADIGRGGRLAHLTDRSGSHAAERMRVDFVANASHELRTPLASILGYVETLSDAAGDDPEIRNRFLKIVFDEARRMERLVDDLMSLSRIEAEKFRTPAEDVDLTALIQKTRSELADTHDGRGRDIVFDQSGSSVRVVGDTAQLSQLLHNLIGNAMKYGRPGTPVNVSLDREGDIARLIVADQGDGISPEHLPRLTERFYRVDPGRSRSVGGTGLGLAIVKHIVERHRGRLEIASQPGVGTRVTVALRSGGDVIKR